MSSPPMLLPSLWNPKAVCLNLPVLCICPEIWTKSKNDFYNYGQEYQSLTSFRYLSGFLFIKLAALLVFTHFLKQIVLHTKYSYSRWHLYLSLIYSGFIYLRGLQNRLKFIVLIAFKAEGKIFFLKN